MDLPRFGIWDAVDILVVTFFAYRLIALLRGTRAVQLLKGLAVLLLVYAVSQPLHLRTINWLLQKSVTSLFVALPIVFLPELRRALEQIGRGRLFTRSFSSMGPKAASRLIGEVTRAAEAMGRARTGALIVFENEVSLGEVVETGVDLDSAVSSDLLVTIFARGTPLHDGATVIRGDRVAASRCLLPLSDDPTLNSAIGTRHRAAIGISEQTDAFVVVVSEETGTISLAEGGQLKRDLTEQTLRDELTRLGEGRPRSGLAGLTH